MRRVWDFHGGIHPPENKTQSLQQPIQPVPLPPWLVVPLKQHIGEPAIPCVSVGDTVLRGQVLAEADGLRSAAVHAPTSGRVVAIEERPVPHPSGLPDRCIVLETDGNHASVAMAGIADYQGMHHDTLRQIIRDAGIAGLGGAGFPTEIKVYPPRHDKVRTVILNAAECEPYITADDSLMRERAADVVSGLKIIAYLLEPQQCLIGIEANKPQAIAALREAIQGTGIELVVVPTKYPSGGEKQLVQLLTGEEVPHNGIPADIGITCHNVGTAYAIHRAVHHGEPLLSRITTVTGQAAGKPGNYEVLLGTPIGHVLDTAEADRPAMARLIMGGPMMGFSIHDEQQPVIKTTNCLLAGTAAEFPPPPPAQACIRCGLCAEACPATLLPQQLYWFARGKEYDKAENHQLFDCIECGACAYVCPSHIPLVDYYRHAKGVIRTERLERDKADRARERFEARQQRIERQQAEREAQRQARLQTAAQAKTQQTTADSDDKQAAIQAAIARSAAKKAPAPKPAAKPTATVDDLQRQYETAQAKVIKLEAQLADATDPAAQDKLKRALDKNRQRASQAQQALADAGTNTTENDGKGSGT